MIIPEGQPTFTMNLNAVKQSPADVLAQQTESVLAELSEMRAGLFTVGELSWLLTLSAKVRWGTSEEYERRLLNEVTRVRDEVNNRGEAGP